MAPKLGAEPRDLPIPRAAGQNTWRRLAREAMLAALSTWFAVVAITAVPSLRPQQIRPQQPPNGSAYLDDFGVFYSASSLLMRGDGEGVYRLDAMQAAERETYGLQPDEFEALPFFNPPQALLLFAPLSMLRAPWAAAVWMAGTLLMAAAGLWLLLRAYPLRMRSLPTV